jgi:hypothetical protein
MHTSIAEESINKRTNQQVGKPSRHLAPGFAQTIVCSKPWAGCPTLRGAQAASMPTKEFSPKQHAPFTCPDNSWNYRSIENAGCAKLRAHARQVVA